MNSKMKSKWTLIAMICLLMFGAFYVMISRGSKEDKQALSSVELLKDSLIQSDVLSRNGSVWLNWMELNAHKNKIEKFSNVDSLTDEDKEIIRNIDQQLNQLLHERN